jgi:hypothetical protein
VKITASVDFCQKLGVDCKNNRPNQLFGNFTGFVFGDSRQVTYLTEPG